MDFEIKQNKEIKEQNFIWSSFTTLLVLKELIGNYPDFNQGNASQLPIFSIHLDI